MVGKTSGAAEEAISAVNLTASFRDIPTDDESCRVVDQEQQSGTEVDRYSDVNLRCEVTVPRLIGRKADPAESKLLDLGFESRLQERAERLRPNPLPGSEPEQAGGGTARCRGGTEPGLYGSTTPAGT